MGSANGSSGLPGSDGSFAGLDGDDGIVGITGLAGSGGMDGALSSFQLSAVPEPSGFLCLALVGVAGYVFTWLVRR